MSTTNALKTQGTELFMKKGTGTGATLSLIHISEPTRPRFGSRMPSSA